VLPADSVWYVIKTFMWPLISSSNNNNMSHTAWWQSTFIWKIIYLYQKIKKLHPWYENLISSSNNWFLGAFSYQEFNFFIFRYRFMVFGIKVCHQMASEGSSRPSCDLLLGAIKTFDWSKFQSSFRESLK
jgi:hypothetical protein